MPRKIIVKLDGLQNSHRANFRRLLVVGAHDGGKSKSSDRQTSEVSGGGPRYKKHLKPLHGSKIKTLCLDAVVSAFLVCLCSHAEEYPYITCP